MSVCQMKTSRKLCVHERNIDVIPTDSEGASLAILLIFFNVSSDNFRPGVIFATIGHPWQAAGRYLEFLRS